MFGFFKFKKLISLTIVQRRYPKIVLFECILSVIVMYIYFPLAVPTVFNIILDQHGINILEIIDHILYPLTHGVVFCEVCRLWLICYDLNYLDSSINNGWKSHINPSFGSKNWWLKHRKTFGNYQYVRNRFLCYGISSGLTIMTLNLIYGYQDWIALVDASLYGVPLIFLIFMYCKCPTITKDDFYFQLEFRTSIIFYIIVLIVYIIGAVVGFYDEFWSNVIFFVDGFISFSFVSILSTLYIPKLITSEQHWTNKSEFKSSTSQNDLAAAFSKQKRMEEFAFHLNHEFCLECLLAFIEMMQFKQYFDEIYFGNVNDHIIVEDIDIKFDFGKNHLKSSIVYDTKNVNFEDDDNDKIKHFKMIAHALFEKYINPGSEMEINISGISRSEYEILMQNKQEWIDNVDISPNDLLILFDDTCLEMFQLMDQSLTRFKRSEEKYSSTLQFVKVHSNMSEVASES